MMKVLSSLSFVGATLSLLSVPSSGFYSTAVRPSTSIGSSRVRDPPSYATTTTRIYYSNWDAFENRDHLELMIGGARYEMVELPDSMMSTTLWVGNLCEFVTDEMLSELFQQASSLKFVPACVARKPNWESMRYGFVTFRSEEEKETAMSLLHGYEFQGKALKVEPILDHEVHGRVRVPEKIVSYSVGAIKRTSKKGELNTMRRVTPGGGSGGSDGDGDKYGHEREQRKARLERRKTRGRYKNQQMKNSRATRLAA